MNREAQYAISALRSQARREEAAKRRRRSRLLLIPFLLGVAVMLFWIALPYPVEHWYLGIVAAALMYPATYYYAA